MPELPEVETMRRGIAGIVGSKISAVQWPPCDCRPITIQPAKAAFARRVTGQTVTAVDRLGKRVVIRLKSTDSIVFEPRMTGLVLLGDAPDEEHLRLLLEFSGGPIKRVWYWDRRGLGSIRVLTPSELEARLGEDRLGPDALTTTPETLQKRMARSRRPIKVALLDQSRVAGVGNLYASEMLHQAGINPELPCNQLEPPQWQKLHAAMIDVLESAIQHEGSTLSDGTYRNALNKSGGYQNKHRVYDREGKPCPTCRRPIVRIVQAQRVTYYCPKCQK